MPKAIVNPEEFTIGDLLEIEDITGETMGAFGEEGRSASAKSILAMAFVSARRDNPKLTLDEVKTWRIDDIEFAGSDDEDEPADPS